MKNLALLFVVAVFAFFVSNNSVFGQSANCQLDLSSSWAVTPDWTSFDPVDSIVCAGSTVTFSIDLDAVYAWDIVGDYPIPGGFVRGGNSNTISEITGMLNIPGDYQFLITIYGSGCNRDTTLYVSVLNPPVADIIADDQTVCAGTTVNFTANGGTPGSSTYDWTVNGNPAPGYDPALETYSYVPVDGDIVNCSISNGACSDDDDTPIVMTVYDNPVPVASFDDLNLQGHFCDGQTATLNEISGDSNITSWEFFVGGTPVVEPDSSYSWSVDLSQDGQNAYVVVTDVNGCQGTSSTLTIDVDQLPDLTVTPIPSSTCNGEYMSIELSGFDGETTGPWDVEFWNPAHDTQYPVVNSSPVLPVSGVVNVDVDIPYGTPGIHVKVIETTTGCTNF